MGKLSPPVYYDIATGKPTKPSLYADIRSKLPRGAEIVDVTLHDKDGTCVSVTYQMPVEDPHAVIARMHRGYPEPVWGCNCTSCDSARANGQVDAKGRVPAPKCSRCEEWRVLLSDLVEREIRCPTCQRLFCVVRAPRDVRLEAVCEGCIVEGRT